jgi:hypothetical protein
MAGADERHVTFRARVLEGRPGARVVERRVGVRVPVGGCVVEWAPPRKHRFARRPTAALAQLVDVSVTGAAVLAAPGVSEGAVMEIRRDGGEGLVEVRRVTHDLSGGHTKYGVAFVWLDPGMQAQVYELVEAGRNGPAPA